MDEKKHKSLPGWKELVCVLFVIGGLALLFSQAHLTIFSDPERKAKIGQARAEIAIMTAAIGSYFTTYGRLPLAGGNNANFTFGTYATSAESLGITNKGSSQANNSAVMAVLQDLTKFENGIATVNSNHSHNPQRIVFLNAKQAGTTNWSGIGPDGVYRDPWGNPYIITLNYAFDNKCMDAFYESDAVSANPTNIAGSNGLMGLARAFGSSSNKFAVPTHIMIWSLGPDGKADSSQKADQGFNKDNITSW